LLRRSTVAAVNEEASHVLGAHGYQRSTHRFNEGFLGASADVPEDVLDLREGFLYGVQIGE
jgi:hypothetical protein